jgi:hypothetical protein
MVKELSRFRNEAVFLWQSYKVLRPYRFRIGTTNKMVKESSRFGHEQFVILRITDELKMVACKVLKPYRS